MRPLSVIKAEIDATAIRLNELQDERRAAMQAEHDSVLRRFDAGMSAREIARELKINKATVHGILWRAGRTERGRTAIRQHIAAYVAAGSV